MPPIIILNSYVAPLIISTPTYYDEVIADGPIVYYRMNETGATEPVDEIGTLTLAPTYDGTPTKGVAGLIANDSDTAIDFAGTGYIRQSGGVMPLGSGTEYVNGSFSIECWVDIASFPGTGDSHVIYDQRSPTGSYKNISLAIKNDGVIQQDKYFPSNLAFLATTPLVAGVKHHIVYTEDGTNRNLYVDGVLNTTDAGVETFSGDPITVWAIGASSVTLGNIVNGVMDEFAIYRHELSAARVLSHYNAAYKSLTYSELIISDVPFAYWRLGEASGTNAVDEVGANDGTYIGAPTLGVTGAIINDLDTAVSMDGVDDYVEITNAEVIPTTGDWTLEAWMKYGPGGSVITRGSDGFGAGWSVQLAVFSSQIHVSIIVSGVTVQAVLLTTASSSKFYHVVGVFDEGVGLYLYVDGVQQAFDASTSTSLRTSTKGLLIGAANNVNSQEGTIDEVATYPVALSPAQILNHYNLGVIPQLSYYQPGPFTGMYVSNGGGLDRFWAIDGNAQTADGAGHVDREIDTSGVGAAGIYGMSYDKYGDRLFVNTSGIGVGVYDNVSTATGVDPGDRLISGALTLLSTHSYVDYDYINDQLYVAGTTGVLVFANASTASGNIAPTRHIQYAGAGFAEKRLVTDILNDRLYYLDADGVSLHIFDNMSTLDGVVSPDRSVTGASTGFIYPWGMAVDISRDIVYIADQSADKIFVYDNASTITGNIAPNRTIDGLAVTMRPIELTVDEASDMLWATNDWDNSVNVYHTASTKTGTINPDRIITGTFNYPGSLAGVEAP